MDKNLNRAALLSGRAQRIFVYGGLLRLPTIFQADWRGAAQRVYNPCRVAGFNGQTEEGYVQTIRSEWYGRTKR
jgi:hypothetical protein